MKREHPSATLPMYNGEVRLVLALVPLFLALVAPAAHADSCSAQAEIIEQTLANEARRARLWNRGWGIGLATAGVAQLVLAAEPEWSLEIDEAQAKTLYLSAGKSFVGASSGLLLPLRVVQPSSRRGDEPCARLAATERALAATARNQRRQRWLGILGSPALNISGSLWLGVGHGLWTEALTSFLLGSAVGLLRMYTQPMGAERALRRYRAGKLDQRARSLSWSIAPLVGTGGFGVRLLIEL